MTAPVVGNDAVALRQEEEQLVVPFVGSKRPAMVEDERLRVTRPPILEEDLRAVICFNEVHWMDSLACS